MTARQEHLMPLIQRADERRSGHREQQHAPAALAADEAKGAGKHREYSDVRELIPRRWNQIHGKRLRAEHEQPEQNARRQQRGPCA